VCVFVLCGCVCQRESVCGSNIREQVSRCVCVRERERDVCVWVCERERRNVCVRVRERECVFLIW